ncbi:hypothetical protein BDQ17DRAFT_1333483 [Cyathus striatus]|nr:hypothetical protein BDQ17DRAFT_1333483 [Cyathus striatus]
MSCFDQRVAQGFYDNLLNELKESDKNTTPCLAQMETGVNLHPAVVETFGPGHFGKTVYHSTSDKPGTDTGYWWFGQVVSSTYGTYIGAHGNILNDTSPINDRTKVKDTIVLEAPSNAPPTLVAAFENQIATIDEIVKKEIATLTNPDAPDNITKNIVPKKRNLFELSDSANSITESSSSAQPSLPKGFYEPNVQPDFIPEQFELQRNKLFHLPYYDINNDRIHPSEVLSKLRPGTLVLIETSMIIWTPTTNKKVFQLQIKSLRVLATSDLPVDMGKLKGKVVPASQPTSVENPVSTRHITAFKSPSILNSTSSASPASSRRPTITSQIANHPTTGSTSTSSDFNMASLSLASIIDNVDLADDPLNDGPPSKTRRTRNTAAKSDKADKKH